MNENFEIRIEDNLIEDMNAAKAFEEIFELYCTVLGDELGKWGTRKVFCDSGKG